MCVICGRILNTCIMSNETQNNSKGEIVIYQLPDGQSKIDVKLENETVWLSQGQMSILFKKDQSDIARHIRNAVNDGEIDESNMQILHNTISKYRPTRVYNLDVIISVGYRVHSQEGVLFRKWATSVLKEYLIKGYVVQNNLIHPLYTESPLESFAGLRVPMAEKVMVDIAVNPEFDYLQGSEVFTIYENAFRSCSVSRSALLRYARRRRSLDTIQKILANIDLPENW